MYYAVLLIDSLLFYSKAVLIYTVKPPYNDNGVITIYSILQSTPLNQAFFGVILRYSNF